MFCLFLALRSSN